MSHRANTIVFRSRTSGSAATSAVPGSLSDLTCASLIQLSLVVLCVGSGCHSLAALDEDPPCGTCIEDTSTDAGQDANHDRGAVYDTDDGDTLEDSAPAEDADVAEDPDVDAAEVHDTDTAEVPDTSVACPESFGFGEDQIIWSFTEGEDVDVVGELEIPFDLGGRPRFDWAVTVSHEREWLDYDDDLTESGVFLQVSGASTIPFDVAERDLVLTVTVELRTDPSCQDTVDVVVNAENRLAELPLDDTSIVAADAVWVEARATFFLLKVDTAAPEIFRVDRSGARIVVEAALGGTGQAAGALAVSGTDLYYVRGGRLYRHPIDGDPVDLGSADSQPEESNMVMAAAGECVVVGGFDNSSSVVSCSDGAPQARIEPAWANLSGLAVEGEQLLVQRYDSGTFERHFQRYLASNGGWVEDGLSCKHFLLSNPGEEVAYSSGWAMWLEEPDRLVMTDVNTFSGGNCTTREFLLSGSVGFGRRLGAKNRRVLVPEVIGQNAVFHLYFLDIDGTMDEIGQPTSPAWGIGGQIRRVVVGDGVALVLMDSGTRLIAL